MKIELSDNYRRIGRHLYERRDAQPGSGFVHVAVIPGRLQSLPEAVTWYERNREMEEVSA